MFASCQKEIPKITPLIDLDLVVSDSLGQPVQGARAWVFGGESRYNSYLEDNPEGKLQRPFLYDISLIEAVYGDSLAISDEAGLILFRGWKVPGIYTNDDYITSPLYFRVEYTQIINGDTTYLTNDEELHMISFEEYLDYGEKIARTVEVMIK